MLPRSGGDYNYLRRAYGPATAFAAGWLQLLAIYPGSLASMAVAAATFQLPALLGEQWSEPVTWLGVAVSRPHLHATLIIVGLTALNHIGVRVSGRVQVLVTSVPIVVLTVTAVWVLAGGPAHAVPLPDLAWEGSAGWPGFEALALAYLPIYFAYSGWNTAIYVAGEIRAPARNLPRALAGGTALVTALYLLLCAGFVAVFGLPGLAGVGEAGTAAAMKLFGGEARRVVAALLLLAMLGSLNATVMAGSRIGYAMALQRDYPVVGGRLHPRFGTPVVALWGQAALAIGLLATGSGLDRLIEYTSTAMLVTGTLAVFAVVLLRRRAPGLPRPFRTWWFPWSPLIYVSSSCAVLGLALVSRRGSDPSIYLAVVWFALAFALHRLIRRWR
ncbi:MAG: APC family permease [Myxococcales bacterium FL481]|nr:MAG: APC family permease [Myxococcales bacterium FL481]